VRPVKLHSGCGPVRSKDIANNYVIVQRFKNQQKLSSLTIFVIRGIGPVIEFISSFKFLMQVAAVCCIDANPFTIQDAISLAVLLIGTSAKLVHVMRGGNRFVPTMEPLQELPDDGVAAPSLPEQAIANPYTVQIDYHPNQQLYISMLH